MNTDPKKLRKGDIVTLIQHCEVLKFGMFENEITVLDKERGFEFQIRGKELIESLFSASQFDKEVELTMTKLVDKFCEIPSNRPFTVVFEKKGGEERTLHGFMVQRNNNLGRSNVIDLDLPANDANKLRQVDHRTIKSFIVDRIQYKLKK